MTPPLAAKVAREYGTPCAVIDMDKVERNIARIQAACDAAGVANRPHIKTHKSPMLAKLQIAAGAKGITCQKLGEAEVMAEAGVKSMLIANQIVGAPKISRLVAVQDSLDLVLVGFEEAGEFCGVFRFFAGRDFHVLAQHLVETHGLPLVRRGGL